MEIPQGTGSRRGVGGPQAHHQAQLHPANSREFGLGPRNLFDAQDAHILSVRLSHTAQTDFTQQNPIEKWSKLNPHIQALNLATERL